MRRYLILLILIAFLTLLMGCKKNCNKEEHIAYNGAMISIGFIPQSSPEMPGWFKESFLQENRVRDAAYVNEEYDPNDPESKEYVLYPDAPKKIIIVIDSIEKHDEIFNVEHEVDYDKEILILYLFSDTNCSYSLKEIRLENKSIQIIYKSKVNATTNPEMVHMLIKMDKIEYDEIEFYSETTINNMRKAGK